MDATRAPRRRALLRLAALSLAPLWPLGASGDGEVNRLPRSALVFGNGAYRAVPGLRNPPNDAAAIARRLPQCGFAATPLIDGGKDDMEAAVADFVARLARDKGVGLFYFAGHGVQLGWRNYLLPVDARIAKPDDVPRVAFDLGTLLDGLRKAGNAMNIVVLDACRDNPFAADFRTGKGLSQVDAPEGTLLAYATSPGNTASDGEGANGLYTENILKEMGARDTKIEDVFKRVRLDVRRATKGAQVPWESTSLEDDFYLFPPARIAAPSGSERERRDADELALWERVEAQAEDALGRSN
jgi:uncharacterized caspase-like protein